MKRTFCDTISLVFGVVTTYNNKKNICKRLYNKPSNHVPISSLKRATKSREFRKCRGDGVAIETEGAGACGQ